ncbi:hypothetical protein HanOQP8_Chr07g0254831 [Helianthus annuus]|nr:hypothetical protein HanOQP8_Chr07g0254831 [Helianthus annuus]
MAMVMKMRKEILMQKELMDRAMERKRPTICHTTQTKNPWSFLLNM